MTTACGFSDGSTSVSLEGVPLSLSWQVGWNGRFLDGDFDRLGLELFMVMLKGEGTELKRPGPLGHEDIDQARRSLHGAGPNGEVRRLAPRGDCNTFWKLQRRQFSAGDIAAQGDREAERTAQLDGGLVDLRRKGQVLRERQRCNSKDCEPRKPANDFPAGIRYHFYRWGELSEGL